MFFGKKKEDNYFGEEKETCWFPEQLEYEHDDLHLETSVTKALRY